MVAAILPEVALSTAHDVNNTVTVYQLLRKKRQPFAQAVGKGLQVHTEKMYRELQRLCRDGDSSNYFIFENMISYNRMNPDFKNRPSPIASTAKNHHLGQSYAVALPPAEAWSIGQQ